MLSARCMTLHWVRARSLSTSKNSATVAEDLLLRVTAKSALSGLLAISIPLGVRKIPSF